MPKTPNTNRLVVWVDDVTKARLDAIHAPTRSAAIKAAITRGLDAMSNANAITLHTKLDSGIYTDCGGGEDVVHGEWTLGPRNLLKAVDALHERRRQARESYGDIGAGRSWLQVGPDVLDLSPGGPFTQIPDAEDTKITGETRTQWAQYVLDAIKSA